MNIYLPGLAQATPSSSRSAASCSARGRSSSGSSSSSSSSSSSGGSRRKPAPPAGSPLPPMSPSSYSSMDNYSLTPLLEVAFTWRAMLSVVQANTMYLTTPNVVAVMRRSTKLANSAWG